MKTKDELIRKYQEYKNRYETIPKYEDFLKFAVTHWGELVAVFGRNAYTKLQQECGDEGNKLDLKRTPQESIMRQYGALALNLLESGVEELPRSSDWIHHKLKPSIDGLRKPPHCILWSEFPRRFSEWVKTEGISGYEKVLNLIEKSSPQSRIEARDREFGKLATDIRHWSPGRRRNNEGEYKVELKGHLKSLGYEVNEEFGESTVDLLVNKKHAIEIKKEPKLGDYDRLFGQLARHLQYQLRAIALIFDAPSEDNFSNFASLVDSYLNKGAKMVDIIKQ